MSKIYQNNLLTVFFSNYKDHLCNSVFLFLYLILTPYTFPIENLCLVFNTEASLETLASDRHGYPEARVAKEKAKSIGRDWRTEGIQAFRDRTETNPKASRARET